MESEPLARIIFVPLLAFLAALFIRAIFAFLETSITSLRLFKLKELAETTKKYNALFHALEMNPHRVLITTLIISSSADVTAAALGTYVMEKIGERLQFSESLGFSLGIGIATIAIVIFGEIIPKNFAKTHSTRLLPSMLWIVNGAFYLLYPFASLLLRFTARINTLLGRDLQEHTWESSEHEIKFLIEYIQQHGLMEKDKALMLKNIFDLGNTPVRDIMIPETNIISINIRASTEDALKLFSYHHFTRLPVYQETTTNIVGIIHLKDIFVMQFQGPSHKNLSQLVRPIIFIPESVKINQLLKDFREKQLHMAIVLNEHGSTVGLITLEDVLEQIVGDIRDEHESSDKKINELSNNTWLVDASIDLDALSSFLNISLTSESALTLGGFLTEQLQHLPKKGEIVLLQHHCFQIHHATTKRVNQVMITKEIENPS